MNPVLLQKYLALVDRNKELFLIIEQEQQHRLKVCSDTYSLILELNHTDKTLRNLDQGTLASATVNQEEERLLEVALRLQSHVQRVEQWQQNMLGVRELIIHFIDRINSEKNLWQEGRSSEDQLSDKVDIMSKELEEHAIRLDKCVKETYELEANLNEIKAKERIHPN
jgi:GTPase involved in cell partitioning and DNA repair